MLLCLLLVGCGGNAEIDRQLAEVERLIEVAPDSAMSIIDDINAERLTGKEQKAHYALLKSMALDKNYIDTTTFDVLQPAIDYYLDHGTPDEKLRTYYYEGRIYQNAGNNEMAMKSFLKGYDLGGEITDSLTLANLLVAQSSLFYTSYMMEDVYDNAIKSGAIYTAVSKSDKAFRSNLTALHVSIVINDRDKADSLYHAIKQIVGENTERKQEFLAIENDYILRFGSVEDQRHILMSSVSDTNLTREYRLNYAICAVEINEPKLALQYFCSEDTLGLNEFSLMKYLLAGAQVYSSNDDYKRAFDFIWKYQVESEKRTQQTFEAKSKVVQEKHKQENLSFTELRKRDRWIIVALIIIIVLLAIILTSIFKLRISKEKSKNAQLECERQTLMTENLQQRVRQLETEAESLRELTKNHDSLQDSAVNLAIQQRIEMLNALIASSISNNEAYSKPYREWLEKETADKKKFMNSTRLALKGTHPAFIAYLENHGLDENEINYLCLYAIGLKGKEVGNYMELRRHYNISSDIRRKLGIDEHETNIGIYVRKLLKQL